MKVTVCQNCGGDGFSVAFVFCHKCQVYAIHRYCLYKLPATFDEYVTWFCEDCEPEITESQTVGDLAPRKSEGAHKREKNKKIGDEAVADVPKCESNPDLHKSVEDMPKCESNPDLSESVADTPICKSRPSNQLIEVNCSDNRVKCHKLGQEKGSVQEDGENSGKEAESIKCHSFQMSSNIPNQDSPLQTQPIVESVWCGSFRFVDENHSPISGLVAHLSSLACPKVVMESKLLSATLELELLPRSGVWPKSFKTTRPTGDNIGLYFFPNNERDEKAFDALVMSMYNKDFAMKAVVKNAELLIFHSTVLPIPYWRFKMKHYLWGLFRKKQALQPVNVLDSVEEKEQKRTTASGVQSPVSTLSNGSGSPSPAAVCPPKSLVML